LWSDSSVQTREEVDLSTLPLLDAQGYEIPVYNTDRVRVSRRTAISHEPTGGFLDLTKAASLFYNVSDDTDNFSTTKARLYLYPQAFTWTYGNIQANSLMPAFDHQLRHISANLFSGDSHQDSGLYNPDTDHDCDSNYIPTHPSEGSEDDSDAALDNPSHSTRRITRQHVLEGISCQFYNSFSHRVRDTAKFHYVQLGLIGSGIASPYATTIAEDTKANRLLDVLSRKLPHEDFRDKIATLDSDNMPEDIRLENVYTLHIYRMPKDKQSGK
jgi:hypothetical protein